MKTKTKLKFGVKDLKALAPCSDALLWVGRHKRLSSAKMWESCDRSDWMLWLMARVKPLTKEQAVTLACRFAMEVLPIFEAKYPNDKRPRLAIEAAQAWLQNPSSAAAYAAAYAAYAAADAADAADAAYAAYAAYASADAAYAAADAAYAAYASADAADAAYAAYASADAADAAYAAADAAADAADAAYASADAAADAAARKKQASIIREIVGNPFA